MNLFASVTHNESPFAIAFFSNIGMALMEDLGSDTVSPLAWFYWVYNPAQLIMNHTLPCILKGTLQLWNWVVFTSNLANDLSHLSVNQSRLSDGPVLGPHQVGKQRKSKLVRSCNTRDIRKRTWPNYRHPLQVSLCHEFKGPLFILHHDLAYS